MARKRMILSLDEELHSILMEFSKETGTPAASFVVQLLEETKPKIVTLTEMVKLAKQNTMGEAHNLLKKMTVDASAELKELKKEIDKEKPTKGKKDSDSD